MKITILSQWGYEHIKLADCEKLLNMPPVVCALPKAVWSFMWAGPLSWWRRDLQRWIMDRQCSQDICVEFSFYLSKDWAWAGVNAWETLSLSTFGEKKEFIIHNCHLKAVPRSQSLGKWDNETAGFFGGESCLIGPVLLSDSGSVYRGWTWKSCLLRVLLSLSFSL